MKIEPSEAAFGGAAAMLLVLAMLGLALVLAACDTRAGRDFTQAKQAYVECVNAKGAAACEGQRAVMDATAGIYAASSGRPQVPSSAVTVGVYK